jgi:hypothetical protein
MSQQDLNSPNFRGAASSTAGAAGMLVAARGQKRWLRWLMYCFAAITLLAVGAGTIDKIANINTLPGCDAQRTRDTLSDLNKANQLNASAYNFIKQISTNDTESAAPPIWRCAAAARSNTTIGSSRTAAQSRSKSPSCGADGARC